MQFKRCIGRSNGKLLISQQGVDRDEIFLKLGEVLSRVIERFGEII